MHTCILAEKCVLLIYSKAFLVSCICGIPTTGTVVWGRTQALGSRDPRFKYPLRPADFSRQETNEHVPNLILV